MKEHIKDLGGMVVVSVAWLWLIKATLLMCA